MPPCPAACSTSSRIRRLSSAPNLRRRAFAGTSGSGGLAKKGTAILVSLTMILPAALLCNYGRRFCLIDVGTEGITVNEDGDAPNNLIYERIVEAKNRGAYEFPLTPTWVHSGHMSRFEIDREKSMGLTGNLRGIVQPQLVQQIVEFDIPPSVTHPQTVALHSIDLDRKSVV